MHIAVPFEQSMHGYNKVSGKYIYFRQTLNKHVTLSVHRAIRWQKQLNKRCCANKQTSRVIHFGNAQSLTAHCRCLVAGQQN